MIINCWTLNNLCGNVGYERRKTMETTEKKKVRIRTIRDALAMLKEIDENTAVTYYFIKKLCDNGLISHVKAGGKKYLLNYDELLDYLQMKE